MLKAKLDSWSYYVIQRCYHGICLDQQEWPGAALTMRHLGTTKCYYIEARVGVCRYLRPRGAQDSSAIRA